MGDSNITGVIGAGNMGGVLIRSMSARGSDVLAYDVDESKTRKLAETCNMFIAPSVKALVDKSSAIIVAVKPDAVPDLLREAGPLLGEGHTLISVAAGISISKIESVIGKKTVIVRAMPNIAALIGESMTVISPGENVSRTALSMAEEIFKTIGLVMTLPERLMDAVTGLSGSGPAYVYTFIQGLADAGVKQGIPRDKALTLALQTVIGSAKQILSGNDEPIAMRNRVASPGGTTIEAIHVLEKSGFSGIVMDAVEAATNKSRKLGGM
jgi:pyrroline-5-carboxylate reductase